MAVIHAGNAINQMAFEEHDGANNAKRVSIALAGAGLTSLPTLYAIVNTNAGGGTTTVTPVGLTTLAPSPNFIGLVTATGNVGISSAATIFAVVNTAVAAQASVVLDNSLAKIGFATVFPAAAWSDPKTYIGLVTAVTINGGTNKTFISLPILLSTGSAATVYVPTNNFYITNLLLNSNATVRVNIRSGVTYLTGNASLGINLNPGSGFVLPGSPDSPWYKSLSTNVPIVIEKADSSGVIAQIGGSVTFFDAL